MTEKTLFDLPSSPEKYGITLTPASLRKIDFSGLDFDTSRKAIYEYIQAYFPDQFNDFVASNGIIMLSEIVASIVAKLALRSDLLANESTLPTARTEQAIINHLYLINQRIKNATAAMTDIEISLNNQTFTDLVVPGGLKLTINGPNNTQLNYEVFKSPYDFVSDIIIPAGKRGVIAFGVEGTTVTSNKAISPGGPSQVISINDQNILDSPLTIHVMYGGVTSEYTAVFDAIERYGSTDKVAEVQISSTGMLIKFGDDVTGKSPKIGSEISVSYRKGGGVRGRIGAFVIDTVRQYRANAPANAPVAVRFRNITASTGGTDRESKEDAKKRAPRDFALQRAIVTAEDYAQAALSFSHPAFGAVAKAIAASRTGLRANIVDLYVLVFGVDGLDFPSAGLRTALKSHINTLNVLTDTVEVHNGNRKPVDLAVNIILHRNAEASVVKQKVETAIDDYFNYTNWQMGQPFYLSNFVEILQAIDGVLYIDLFSPNNNILAQSVIGTEENPTPDNRIGTNEIVVLQKKTVNYYYEKI